MQVGRAEQPDHPIPQILPLQQNEDRDDQHDGRGGQRFHHRCDDPLRDLHGGLIRLTHFHRDWLLRIGRCRGAPRCLALTATDVSRPAVERAREIRHVGQHELLQRIDLLLDR